MSRRSGHSEEYDADDRDEIELASLLPDGEENGDVEQSRRTKPRTVLPPLQVFVLLVLYLSGAFNVTLTAPFIVQLVGSLGIAPDKVGYYIGILDSLSYAGEAISVLQWGRLSDKIGRRPVLLICSLGLACTSTSLGLATRYIALIITRSAEGLLNGNSGTIKAILAELSDGDEAHLAKVFSLLPLMWAVGGTVGPILGGQLANPATRYPKLFSATLWKSHVYLLPLLSGVAFRIIALILVFLFLKETLHSTNKVKHADTHNQEITDIEEPVSNTRPLWSLPRYPSFVTRRLFVTLLNYAFLAFLDSSLYATYNLLLASPLDSGGLAFPPNIIGYILGTASFCHGLVQAFCFPWMLRKWTARTVYIASIMAYGFLYINMPIMNAVAKGAGRVNWVVWMLILLQEVAFFCSYSAYGCIYIFISQAAPSQSALGKSHGLGQTVSSVMGSIGPAVSTSLIAVSWQHNLLGGSMGYLLIAGVAGVALCCTRLLPVA